VTSAATGGGTPLGHRCASASRTGLATRAVVVFAKGADHPRSTRQSRQVHDARGAEGHHCLDKVADQSAVRTWCRRRDGTAKVVRCSSRSRKGKGARTNWIKRGYVLNRRLQRIPRVPVHRARDVPPNARRARGACTRWRSETLMDRHRTYEKTPAHADVLRRRPARGKIHSDVGDAREEENRAGDWVQAREGRHAGGPANRLVETCCLATSQRRRSRARGLTVTAVVPAVGRSLVPRALRAVW